MRILYNNYQTSPRFCARNEEIRTADNIQRKVNNTFDFISSSRAKDFYETSTVLKHKIKAREIFEKYNNIIFKTRCAADILGQSGVGIGVLYADDLDLSEHTGLGNCMEYAKAAVAALCANGFYNSERINLRYEIKFINKETNETEYVSTDTLDHSFAITDLNCRHKKDIVVDPWLGFVDYETEAITKFKNLFSDDIKKLEQLHTKMFKLEKLENGEDYDPDDYKMETSVVFAPREEFATQYQKERLGDYARHIYPGLLLNKKA